VRVPLAGRGDGDVRVTDADQIEIVTRGGDVSAWIAAL
jgi:hypothetical protein